MTTSSAIAAIFAIGRTLEDAGDEWQTRDQLLEMQRPYINEAATQLSKALMGAPIVRDLLENPSRDRSQYPLRTMMEQIANCPLDRLFTALSACGRSALIMEKLSELLTEEVAGRTGNQHRIIKVVRTVSS